MLDVRASVLHLTGVNLAQKDLRGVYQVMSLCCPWFCGAMCPFRMHGLELYALDCASLDVMHGPLFRHAVGHHLSDVRRLRARKHVSRSADEGAGPHRPRGDVRRPS